MVTAGISDIQEDTFSTKSEHTGDVILIEMRGNADTAIHEQLKRFLDSLDVAARRLRVKEAVFELHELYFLNSSCLSLLLRMINGLLDPQSGHAYKVRFRSNPNLRWQQRSLQALHSYAQDIVIVE